MTWHKTVLAAALLVTLTGCAGSAGPTPSATPSTPASASATGTPSTGDTGPAPTAEQVTWAGNVCTATTDLQTQVQGLASAAATGGTGVVASIADQMTQIQTSTGTLLDTVKSAPRGSGDDSAYANVRSSAEKVDTSMKALQASVSQVQSASGAALVTALAKVVVDTGTMLTDLAGTVKAITTAMTDASSTLGQAFQGAPACAALTAN